VSLPLSGGLDGLWAGPTSSLVALIYDDGPAFNPLICALVRSWKARGLRLAGVVQSNEVRDGRRRCDMILEDLSSGRRFPISEDRGAMARGCHLDHDALSRIILDVHQSLSSGVDALVVNKFGKEEAEGRGFVDTIAAAMEHGIPAVIGVPLRNLTAFRLFGDGAAEEVCVSSIIPRDRDIFDDLSHPAAD
jgi:nucleoside-triphosphatase THEP1